MERLWEDVECPLCLAKPGEKCVTNPKKLPQTYPHAARRQLSNGKRVPLTVEEPAPYTPTYERQPVRLKCKKCNFDLQVDLILTPRPNRSYSLQTMTSVVGTLAWASTHLFLCGGCFIKMHQERKAANGTITNSK